MPQLWSLGLSKCMSVFPENTQRLCSGSSESKLQLSAIESNGAQVSCEKEPNYTPRQMCSVATKQGKISF